MQNVRGKRMNSQSGHLISSLYPIDNENRLIPLSKLTGLFYSALHCIVEKDFSFQSFGAWLSQSWPILGK